MLLLFGCANTINTEEIIQVKPDQIQDISFKDQPGRLTILFDESLGINFIVWLKELDPDQGYEISLINADGNGGVIFGPEDNLDIKLGSIEGETILRPNQHGELYVAMVNPKRLFRDAAEVKAVIKTRDRKIVTESFSFKFSENPGQ